jgi:hypothetical protein
MKRTDEMANNINYKSYPSYDPYAAYGSYASAVEEAAAKMNMSKSDIPTPLQHRNRTKVPEGKRDEEMANDINHKS